MRVGGAPIPHPLHATAAPDAFSTGNAAALFHRDPTGP